MDVTPQSKRERRLAAREERRRVAAEGRRKAEQRRRVQFGILGLIVVALVAAAVFFLTQVAMRPMPGYEVPTEGRDHVSQGTPITYKHDPPSSGPHYPNPTPPGVYSEPQATGSWVHSLEHGYVVILYNCPTACPDLVQQLQQFYDSAPKSSRYRYQKIVVAPYPTLEHRISLLAWGREEDLDQFDADTMMAFYQAYLDHGPEDAP